MARAGNQTFRTAEDWISRLRHKWAEWRVAHITTHGIGPVLGAAGGIGQIIFSAVLHHPGAFHPAEIRILIVATEALPRVSVGQKWNHFLRLADRPRRILRVKFNAPNSGVRRATPVIKETSSFV